MSDEEKSNAGEVEEEVEKLPDPELVKKEQLVRGLSRI